MLLTDLYCNKEKFISSSQLCSFIGFIALLLIVFVPSITSYTCYWIKILAFIVLFYVVLTNQRIKKIFSNKYLTIIGGMCYSIYLLHFGVLSVAGKLLQSTRLPLSSLGLIPVYYILFAAVILIISAVYFLVVEKPFMKMVIRKK